MGLQVAASGDSLHSTPATQQLGLKYAHSVIRITIALRSKGLSAFPAATPSTTLCFRRVTISVAKDAAVASSLRNGTVRGFEFDGVRSSVPGLRVHQITVMHNGQDGIDVSTDTLITESVVRENLENGVIATSGSAVRGVVVGGNGRHGIVLPSDGSVVEGSTSRGNASRGFGDHGGRGRSVGYISWRASGTPVVRRMG